MKRLFPCTILIIVLASHAAADQITLKNGDRVTGKIILMNTASTSTRRS